MSVSRDNVDLLRTLLETGGGDQGVMFVQNVTNTDGGSITPDTDTQVVFNTEVINTIDGASFAANEVTLPAGTYRVFARAPLYCAANVAPHVAWLFDAEGDPGEILVGKHAHAAVGQNSDATVLGQFVLASAATLELRQRTTGAITAIMGNATNLGVSAVLAEMFIQKVG